MRRRTMVLGGLALSTARASAASAPIMLELFTSQGCSSCPPADALLGELARRDGVIALAWHVDYWNNLGWRDPYANRMWTERQNVYAALIGDEVYTPALVVNGARMVVGSDGPGVRTAMRTAPPLSYPVGVRRMGDRLTIDLGGANPPAKLLLAIYDPEIVTQVGAGENGGRTLREFRVVREVRSLSPTSGEVALGGVSAAQGAAVLAQDVNGRVIGAADARPAVSG